jgi:Tfp pilus assembly protein PilV
MGRPRQRAGFTLIELAGTSLILIALMGLIVSVLGWISAENRWVDRRRAAETELANVMERISLEPWERISNAEQKASSLSAEAARILPGGELAIAVHEEPSSLKRIRVEVRWRDKSGGMTAPMRLTTWVARHDGGSR